MEQKILEKPCPVHRVGSGPGHHFFGYYNKTNWDRSDRYLLANRFERMDAPLTPQLTAAVGFFDLHDGARFQRVGETRAWNWQMGCQLQWLDGVPGRQVIYNVRTADRSTVYPGYGSVIVDVDSGKRRSLPMPVYVVAPNARFALCVNYSRLYKTHPTIGYCHEAPVPEPLLCPPDDGLYLMDLASGAARMVVSYQDLKRFHPVKSMDKAIHWVSHIEINPASTRVLFLHRWTERIEDETCFLHRLITMNPDGTGLRLLECSDHPLPQLQDNFDPDSVGVYDYEKSEYQISHPLWQDERHIIVWGPHAGEIHYHLYTDDDRQNVEVIGRHVLTENGHMTFSPTNRNFLLSDTYPDSNTNERLLILFDVARGIRYDVGSFYTDPKLKKENRCDLHPRWSRDGRLACIDSVHESERQMYIVDLSSIIPVG